MYMIQVFEIFYNLRLMVEIFLEFVILVSCYFSVILKIIFKKILFIIKGVFYFWVVMFYILRLLKGQKWKINEYILYYYY